LDVPVYQTGQSGFHLMCHATVFSTGPCPAKLDGLISNTVGSGICRTSDEASETTMTDPDDWRTPLVLYLENHGHIADKNVWRQAFIA
jgi:hypothetical protein